VADEQRSTSRLAEQLPAVIVGSRVVLEAAEVRHAEELFEVIHSDRERLSRASHWVTSVHSVEDQRARLERGQGQRAAGSGFSYMIRPQVSAGLGRIVGGVGAFAVDSERGSCEIGYWVAGEHEGRGFVSDAVRALGSACFALGVHRIQLRCGVENGRSERVARSCGYVLEGRLRQVRTTDAGWVDDFVFSRLASDT
jgi:ribosomal-protein-serine acetyltransferase